MQFVPLTDKDFDAYLPKKWQSNVFNRDRLEVKQKLQALGQVLAPSMVDAGGAPLECEVSAEHPALWNQRKVQNQHLFFSRNEAARAEIDGIISKGRTMAALIEDPSPLRNHIFLSLMLDHQQVELALKLHSDAAVDRENLQRLGQDFFLVEKLVGLLNQLPPEYRVSLTDQGQLQGQDTPAAEVTPEVLEQLITALPTADAWFSVRLCIDRADAMEHGEGLAEFARQQLSLLLPLMHCIAWIRDNDFISISETLKKEEIRKEARGLEQGSKIQVVRGMFAGKRGEVLAVAAKGKLKVRLGSLTVNLDSKEVEAK